jgi:aromatase
MGGTWIVEATGATTSRVVLLHDYRAIGDDPDKLAWIDSAVDRNSRSELAALKRNVELAGATDLLLSFTDAVHIDGTAKNVYDFLNEADRWSERLPHVARVQLAEETPGLQLLTMDTRAKDGSEHTTTSVRVCFAPDRIVYKQIVLPALMTLHTGFWELTEDGSGTTATSGHTVVLNTANIAAVLGPDADLERARAYVRTALSTNSRATLGYAKAYAEAR